MLMRIVVAKKNQNIMSSVALNRRDEEPWTSERVATFIDLLGYRVFTLKSDTELSTVAFRNRVAEVCKAEVATEDRPRVFRQFQKSQSLALQ